MGKFIADGAVELFHNNGSRNLKQHQAVSQ